MGMRKSRQTQSGQAAGSQLMCEIYAFAFHSKQLKSKRNKLRAQATAGEGQTTFTARISRHVTFFQCETLGTEGTFVCPLRLLKADYIDEYLHFIMSIMMMLPKDNGQLVSWSAGWAT